jgi:hypothetical protein
MELDSRETFFDNRHGELILARADLNYLKS